jgi:hypothetical protein
MWEPVVVIESIGGVFTSTGAVIVHVDSAGIPVHVSAKFPFKAPLGIKFIVRYCAYLPAGDNLTVLGKFWNLKSPFVIKTSEAFEVALGQTLSPE